jgi:Circularly permutated YpsA SLOG family
MIITVISGGQTGIDRMSLEAAREAGLPTGGSAPKDFLTGDGPDPTLQGFGLIALSTTGYNARTLKNVIDGDGTVIYGDLTGGTRLTAELCELEKKPYIVNPTPGDLVAFVRDNRVEVLDVAGNRGSKLAPERLAEYRGQFRMALSMIATAEKEGLSLRYNSDPDRKGGRTTVVRQGTLPGKELKYRRLPTTYVNPHIKA